MQDIAQFHGSDEIIGEARRAIADDTRIKRVRAGEIDDHRRTILREAAPETHGLQRDARLTAETMKHHHLRAAGHAEKRQFCRDLIRQAGAGAGRNGLDHVRRGFAKPATGSGRGHRARWKGAGIGGWGAAQPGVAGASPRLKRSSTAPIRLERRPPPPPPPAVGRSALARPAGNLAPGSRRVLRNPPSRSSRRAP